MKKRCEFQLALGTSSSQILIALGSFCSFNDLVCKLFA